MHDEHEPSCALCTKFVFPFGPGSPLADWGYCASDPASARLTKEELARIEERVRQGDYGFLQDTKIPLYEAFGEGCGEFEDSGHHH